jgi:hypothetical protein
VKVIQWVCGNAATPLASVDGATVTRSPTASCHPAGKPSARNQPESLPSTCTVPLAWSTLLTTAPAAFPAFAVSLARLASRLAPNTAPYPAAPKAVSPAPPRSTFLRVVNLRIVVPRRVSC